MKNKIFLGGTCGNSIWRDELIPLLNCEYFNPVVDVWTLEAQEIEKYQKEVECNVHLYVITSEMEGVFSIAEAVDSVHNKDKLCIFVVNPDGFNDFQLKSLSAVSSLISQRNGIGLKTNDLSNLAKLLNNLS